MFELGLQSAVGLQISHGQIFPVGSPGLQGMETFPQVGCSFRTGTAASVFLALVSPDVQ